MIQQKIVRNESGSTIQILNREMADTESYDVPPHMWAELAFDSDLHSLVTSGDFVINDGNVDLIAPVGLAHIQNIQGVVRNHSDITLLPAVTENAPAIKRLSDASIGFYMEIDNEIYGQSRINNYAGDDVEVQLHMAIDNTTADRWIEFEVSYITTNGLNDKAMDVVNGVLQMGAIEVPTTAYRIFEAVVNIPASAFANGEKYIYIGIKRVIAAGETAPTDHPVILRYCKRYWEIQTS
jgi:hypothetical protein